jgi:hypothetical protein
MLYSCLPKPFGYARIYTGTYFHVNKVCHALVTGDVRVSAKMTKRVTKQQHCRSGSKVAWFE